MRMFLFASMVTLFCAAHLYADRKGLVSLQICNRESVDVNVAHAVLDNNIFSVGSWIVRGWMHIPSGECKPIVDLGTQAGDNDPRYIAVEFTDATGVRGAARLEPPDAGTNFWMRPIFSKATTTLCVPGDNSSFVYRTYDKHADGGSCAEFHLDGGDQRGYIPFPAALYFDPNGRGMSCSGEGAWSSCYGGDFTLDIKFSSDRAIPVGPQQPAGGPAVTSGQGWWTDPATGVMWAKHDNGSDVDWNEANRYCHNLSQGGHSDWRLPSIDELQGIYDPAVSVPFKYPIRYHIKGGITLTWVGQWSATQNGSGVAWELFFDGGVRYSTRLDSRDSGRALCVRRSGE
jgi:hypothetical protein